MVAPKPSLYIVFDQLPKKKDGGLVATYINFVQQFQNEFNIKLVSAFSNGGNDIEAFEHVEMIDLSDYVLDNRFFRAFSYLKKGEFKRFFHALASAVRFFAFIPIARHKTDLLLKDSMVIAVSPAAAIFIGKKVSFILEIHTKYEYFWGKNPIGKLQSSLAAKPALTLFRNKTDAEKARGSFAASYIYNGVEHPSQRSECSTKTAEPLPERKPHSALYVGGVVEHKNPLLLARCAQKVHEAIPDLTLDIYGVGDMTETLQHEIDRRGLESVVNLKGFVDDKSIYAHYEQFWFSSNLEGFGLVLVEAMANRTPVITTNWGDAVYEIVNDGQTGFVVSNETEFCKRSIELFNDPDLSCDLAEAAYRDFEERFSTEQNKAAWEKILSSVYSDIWQSTNED